MGSMARFLLLIITCVSLFTAFAGCVMHEAFEEQMIPENELAVVQGYWRYRVLFDEELRIVSVDGRMPEGKSGWPYAYSVSVAAGRHWLQISVLRNSREATMCAFEYTFSAGCRYKLEHLAHGQTLLAHPVSSTFKGFISISVTGPYDTVQHVSVPTICGIGPMCRQNLDCPSDYYCTIDEKNDFGTCKTDN